MDSSKIERGMTKTEERDQIFGRVFGILALFRSSRLVQNDYAEVVENCTKEIVRLYNMKSWIQDVCVQTLITMLKNVHVDSISTILSQCKMLFEENAMNEDEELVVPHPFTPASLVLMFQVQKLLAEKEIDYEDNDDLSRLFVHNTEVTPYLLHNYMNVYKETSFTFPKLHPLWTTTIDYICSLESNASEEVLLQWWSAVVDQVFSSSPERKG